MGRLSHEATRAPALKSTWSPSGRSAGHRCASSPERSGAAVRACRRQRDAIERALIGPEDDRAIEAQTAPRI